jgi:hypothetical protein
VAANQLAGPEGDPWACLDDRVDSPAHGLTASAGSAADGPPPCRRAGTTIITPEFRSAGLSHVIRSPRREEFRRSLQGPSPQVITSETARSLVNEFGKDRMGAAFALMLTMGLRRSEVLALRCPIWIWSSRPLG